MRSRIALVVVSVLCLGQFAKAAPIPTRPVFTNKTRFRIPYNFDPAEMRRLGAQEIQLFASTDRGTRWQQIQSVAPETGKFGFQAPADGEYWFSVRTLDAQNRLHPDDKSIVPGLQVVVDTHSPQLQLSLRQTAAGRVQLSWNAIDENLDISRLRLEFIQPGSDNWQIVGVIPKPADQTEWTVPQGGLVAVRGSVSDYAGNVGQSQIQVTVAPANESVPKPAVPDLRERIAGQEIAPGGNPSIPEQYPSATQIPRETAVNKTYPPFGQASQVSQRAQLPGMNEAPERRIGNGIGNGIGNSLVSMQQGTATEPQRRPDLPVGRTRMVNSRRFQIGYRIQDVGSSGISAVELYITNDRGKSWWKYGEDPDRQSPFNVEVPREGTYGFAILVRSGVGLAADPPQAGEEPGIVVVVDETAPKLQLLPLEQGRGAASNKILIRWLAQDQNLGDNPISLYYATSENGPWQPIAGGLPDTQNYLWTVGLGGPSKFYIRLEVRDAAGNVTRAETPQPALIDMSRPTARIVDIEANAEIEVGPR